MDEKTSPSSMTRRGFLIVSGGAAIPGAAAPDAGPATVTSGAGSNRKNVRLKVNGRQLAAELEPRVTLLDYLRDRVGLTGTKKGCNEGACGTCTVLIDGQRMNACLTLAVQCDGREVTTIEGVATGSQLHPVQQAFIRHDAFQCGYCTPGQIMSAIACIAEGHTGSEEEVREWMSGNICRCAAYPQITAAILDAAVGCASA